MVELHTLLDATAKFDEMWKVISDLVDLYVSNLPQVTSVAFLLKVLDPPKTSISQNFQISKFANLPLKIGSIIKLDTAKHFYQNFCNFGK